MLSSYEKYSRNKTEVTLDFVSGCNYISEKHHHFEYELLFVSAGSCKFNFSGDSKQIEKNTFVFIEPGEDHSITNADKNFRFISLIFTTSVFDKEEEQFYDFLKSIKINNFPIFSQKISELFLDLDKLPVDSEKKFFYYFHLKTTLFCALDEILKTEQYTKNEFSVLLKRLNKSSSIVIANAVQYIQKHFKENISLNDLLKETNYSKSHFIRLFKNETGMNFTDYVNKYRVEKSCQDLIYSEKNVTQIAVENGFNNIQYFSKIFKSYMNITPKQYQKKIKK